MVVLMLFDTFRHGDGSGRTDESAEVTSYALAAHKSWRATDGVELKGLVPTITTRHNATATAHTCILIELGIDDSVAI